MYVSATLEGAAHSLKTFGINKFYIYQPDHRAGAAMHLAVTKGLCS